MTKVPWSEVIPAMALGEIMWIPYKTMGAEPAIYRAARHAGVRVRVYPSEAGGIELWRTR